ncbi:hypothetical protein B0I35DRAFT_410383 [Stachybotrys elegans]|uniref:gamma-glutamylcyclotransferase n=1 Tax=Stachybotrys elegans TaxID=80388 RepID=A0A8K0WP35_9HYPO|nr:hypothetical protein B0I35DRAFT_410383 [Stachybotrys elegans]
MCSQEDSQPSQGSVMTLVDENRSEILYFAYGSNLSTAQMRQRCPYSTPIGLGYLAGWRWIINQRGFANIVPLEATEDEGSPAAEKRSLPGETKAATTATAVPSDSAAAGKGVYGLLYLLPPQDEEKLDGYEGVPWAYQKMHADMRWVRDDMGREQDVAVRALIYVDSERTGEAAPREEYIVRMEDGIEDAVRNWGLDEEYVNETMRRFLIRG